MTNRFEQDWSQEQEPDAFEIFEGLMRTQIQTHIAELREQILAHQEITEDEQELLSRADILDSLATFKPSGQPLLDLAWIKETTGGAFAYELTESDLGWIISAYRDLQDEHVNTPSDDFDREQISEWQKAVISKIEKLIELVEDLVGKYKSLELEWFNAKEQNETLKEFSQRLHENDPHMDEFPFMDYETERALVHILRSIVNLPQRELGASLANPRN
jgi:hypothetical protein